MIIRKAENKDIPRIINLLKQVNDVHADGRPDIFIHGKTKYVEDELEQIIHDPATPVFVCVNDEDETLGYAFCLVKRTYGHNNLVDNNELYIDDICVDEDHRREGIATMLYDEVIHYAKLNAFDRVTLHVWECNPGAVKFYEKCGMKAYFHAMEVVL